MTESVVKDKDLQTEESTDLSPKQFRYIQEYLLDPSSQTKAAIRAGYFETDAHSRASKLMAMPKVRAAIEEGQKARAARMGLTQDRVLQELLWIAFANPGDVLKQDENGNTNIDLKRLPRNVAASLGEISITEEKSAKPKFITKVTAIKPADRIAALNLVAKHLGMLTDKVEHSGVLTLEQLVEESMKRKDSLEIKEEPKVKDEPKAEPQV